MIKIDVDAEVYEILGKIAIPFKETTPNMVIRRMIGLTAESGQTSEVPSEIHKNQKAEKPTAIAQYEVKTAEIDYLNKWINELRSASSETHPAILTFLMDKYHNSRGNYKTSDIVNFMKKSNFELSNGQFRNPWMKAPYGGEKNGLVSCQRTIEHFRQTRKFGCWGGKDIKENCDSEKKCIYHPKNKTKIQNKCDLRNGVIWKRISPDSPFSYGKYYLDVIKKQLLKGHSIPLKPLLKIIFPKNSYNDELIEEFKTIFHINEEEFGILFTR